MLLGIDVGGTHTDTVILDDGRVVAEAKIPTDHDDLLSSIQGALDAVLTGMDPAQIRSVNLSTTLSTNAIVENKIEDVGVLVSTGPGIDPENYRVGGHYHVVAGAVDHRGTEVMAPDEQQLEEVALSMEQAGIKVFAAVGKFSTRNPDHERAMAGAVGHAADFVTMGHGVSGVLNFPRRVATAYFNSAVWRTYNDFAWAMQESLTGRGLKAEINILKADGGTLPLAVSRRRPIETILSGPAASVMGMIALCDPRDDSVLLDIGGTTTDIAVFADGSPVIEDQGMTVGSYPTLVKSLKIRSIGVGGDSVIRVNSEGMVTVGPDRKGPALATCGNSKIAKGQACSPALTDALNTLGLSAFGDVEASRRGIRKLAELSDLAPEVLARRAVDNARDKIVAAANDLVDELNDRPVYTILELLKGKTVRPKRYSLMGGPAQAMGPQLEEVLGVPVTLPAHFAVANAIGAALTRTTMDVELFADTQKKRMFIPGLGIATDIPASYTLEQAERDAEKALKDYLVGMGGGETAAEPEISESGSFNMVDDHGTVGRNIRVKCQIQPGIVTRARV
ncbi:hydantoinase/oxoprolinase family protein [Desulfovibrio ferrophilus]|uniref:Hydantoinase/oxoprolinase family protein n=1 Tax=Desulfovibrio ferrophilus TaxID=241368 RepID=A0A2Z6B1P7_9BACT|nr:hydantoinase/oxoprolinase family protein [Desulfovibrio ferrophilus]BBD09414.1 hydantoinase/oxoprolinase family protein [Desulfovibrio ferrophilus]